MNPCKLTARTKLIKRLQLKGKNYLEAEELALDIEDGKIFIDDLKLDKVAMRYIKILDPKNWIPCNGEAHSNPFIDNCGVCMPNWGKVWNGEKK